MAGGRSVRPAATGIRGLCSYRVFVSAMFTLLFLAALSVLLSTNPSSTAATSAAGDPSVAGDVLRPYLGRTFLALKSDPLRTRLHLLLRQAADHSALVHAYAAYARRLKLDNSRQLRAFEDLTASLSSLAARLDSDLPSDEDSLRPLEKEAKDRIKFARALISESKESFDTQLKIQKLRDTIFAVQEQLHRAKKLGALTNRIAAGSTPKSLHCLAMRLMEDRIAHPDSYRRPGPDPPELADPNLYHSILISDNIIAVSTVINSAIRNAADPWKHVFHVVTDPMYLNAMQVWFTRRPPTGGARVEIKSVADFGFLNSSYSPVVRQIEGGRRDLSLLHYLRFYLPEMYPSLQRVVFLEDDVVVQKDLAGLWRVDLDGKANGAVEMCFGGFRRYSRYMNFSHPVIRERFSPRACAWAYGVNVFDLDAWRRERSTEKFHEYQDLNEDGIIWNPGTVLPAGLMTFYTTTKPLEKSWHVTGLGYNPSISLDEIRNAAVIHFNGHMKPWLDVALNQYKHLWTKYVDTEMEFLPLCNFGL
ncbi:probable galacturonosyltransferase 9 [Phoenix dactylifera]|uniref:Hexosyltransferase n=1 Tax=Phoenix dactylifera TaxID=42345 RepID=A0A8B7BS84_PHODC|nr:probable galacturonosyltransferase 9 [Phoenix dactylifera]XP_038976509.1 probable galacturonosyltransferase 9 [Phoenix dactylifera]